jgi:ribonuclease HI
MVHIARRAGPRKRGGHEPSECPVQGSKSNYRSVQSYCTRSTADRDTLTADAHTVACGTALRIACSPAYDAIKEVRSRKKNRTVSPLEKLTKRVERKTGIKIEDLEVITPFAAPPWWIPRTINFQANKEVAEGVHKELLEETEALIIGAAALAPHRTIRSYLGPSKAFTVYSAELYGIVLAMILTSIPGHEKTRVIICIDNQAAIRAVSNPGNSSGQHLFKHIAIIVRFINTLRKMGIEVELHWLPAHKGIEGNEAADIAAKQATVWSQKKNKRATLWKESNEGRGLYALEPKPRKNILKLHDKLPKKLSALAVQIRTGKIGLRLFLYRRGVPGIDTERCQCRQGPQTVEHVLFNCRKYSALRRGLWKEEMKSDVGGDQREIDPYEPL